MAVAGELPLGVRAVAAQPREIRFRIVTFAYPGGPAILFAYAWWAPIVLAGAWLTTHWLLRESAVWKDRNTEEVRSAQRDADYAYRLAVDPPASKELRLFGLAEWTIERFVARRTRLLDLHYAATRLRESATGNVRSYSA